MKDCPREKIAWWSNNLLPYTHSLLDAVAAKHVSMGELTKTFENYISNHVNSAFTVCFPSGTAGITACLMATGLDAKSTVALPNRTWIGTANAANLLGMEIELVDSLPNHQNTDPSSLEFLLATSKNILSAFIYVPINGSYNLYQKIIELCSDRKLPIIVDACQAFSSNQKATQEFLNLGSPLIYSFGMPKLVSTGLGGCVCTNSKAFYHKLLALRNQGISPYSRNPIEAKIKQPGFNFKYTDLQAAIGIEQMKVIDRIRNSHIENIHLYSESLSKSKVNVTQVDNQALELPLRTEVMMNDVYKLYSYLKSSNIETSLRTDNINSHPLYAFSNPIPLINSKRFEDRILVLPSGPSQTSNDIEFVCTSIKSYLKNNNQ